MGSLELWLGAALVGALTFYLLLGGADFGAGMWTFFAFGRGGLKQRILIDHAIGPIWEANHVWLIVAVTILFTAFPAAFSAITVSLHIPLSLMLVGIVVRGTAFAIRTHDISAERKGGSARSIGWRYVFACSSLMTPGLIGIIVGAVASGRIPVSEQPVTSFQESFVSPWLAAFPLAVGLLTSALVAYLAASYLLVESPDRDLQEMFRRRSIGAWCVVALSSAWALHEARRGAPQVYQGLRGTAVGLTAIFLTIAVNCGALVSLLKKRDRLARLFAAGGAVLIVWGWALAQFPVLVEPNLTIYDAAPPATLRLLAGSLAAGSLILFPLLFYLYRIFKGHVLLGLDR
ncbi:MAG TPA: cytochrome d ubiquinol oxidase subunit II [Nitrospira sp.]